MQSHDMRREDWGRKHAEGPSYMCHGMAIPLLGFTVVNPVGIPLDRPRSTIVVLILNIYIYICILCIYIYVYMYICLSYIILIISCSIFHWLSSWFWEDCINDIMFQETCGSNIKYGCWNWWHTHSCLVKHMPWWNQLEVSPNLPFC